MEAHFTNAGSGTIIAAIAAEIVANKAYLSEIDGKIGDGDHGVNMAKGFGKAADQITDQTSFHDGLTILSNILMNEIGGSMGPLYGMMFMEMAATVKAAETINAKKFESMLKAGIEGVASIGGAKLGDKTLLDCLIPAVSAFSVATETGKEFSAGLSDMIAAAETGRDSTIDLVAKIGRSSRLGERSRGVLDAGATSCCMILKTLGVEIASHLTTHHQT
jgi:phosphoenolpyruvate---glycerone phosphotransferase subunit DhaL